MCWRIQAFQFIYSDAEQRHHILIFASQGLGEKALADGSEVRPLSQRAVHQFLTEWALRLISGVQRCG
jgi:hypothetical protein